MCSETNALGVQEIKVKPWYKMTELGVIPEDWSIFKLESLLLWSPKYWIWASAVDWSDEFYTYLRITDISIDWKFIKENKAWVDDINAVNYLLNDWELVFARTWASTWKTYLYNKDDWKLVYAWFLIKVKPNPKKLNSYFLYQYTKTSNYWNWIKVMSMRSWQPWINWNEYASLNLPVPNIEEQKLIAQTLSDTDELMNSLDELIVKKEKIKEWTMQELLTWKRRLPWFDWEWEIKKISDILDVTRWYVLSVNEMYQSKSELYKYPVYSSQTRNKWLTWYYKEYLYEDSITWTTDWANAWDVNYREWKFYCTNVCWVLKSNNWYANLCVAKALWMISKKYVSYIWNPKLMNNVVAGIELKLPPTIEEQKAIAEVLSDMDNEIENLKTKRDKYKKLKEWMMQELLTWKIRLV